MQGRVEIDPVRHDPDPGTSVAAATMELDAAVASLGGMHAIRLLPESHSARPAPHFVHGPCSPDMLRHFHNDQYHPAVSAYVASNLVVVGPWFATGSLLLRDGIGFSCTGIGLDPGSEQSRERLQSHRQGLADGSRTIRRVSGQSLLLATNGHQIYGHWLVDFLPKIHIVQCAGFRLDNIKVLLPTNMQDFGRQFLLLLGFAPENIVPYDPDTEAILADELVIPTTLRWGGRLSPMFPDAIGSINERIEANNRLAVGSGPTRLFLSRAQSGRDGRPLVNQAGLEARAVQAGLCLVHPEKLSLLEQVALFRGARRVAGQYGSALHATIFSRPGVVVAGMHGPPPATFDAIQSGIAERLGQITGYVFGHRPADLDDQAAMIVDEDEFSGCIKTHLA